MFRMLPTLEPASITCDNEQGDQSSSAGPHWNLHLPQQMQENLVEGFEKNEGEGPGRYNLERKKAIRGEPVSSELSTQKTLISVHKCPLQDGQTVHKCTSIL